MKSVRYPILRNKLIGSFIKISPLVSIVSYFSFRTSPRNVTENALPPVQALAKTTDLVKSIQAEVLEFVAVGEEALEDLVGNIKELDILLKRQVSIAFANSNSIIEARLTVYNHEHTLNNITGWPTSLEVSAPGDCLHYFYRESTLGKENVKPQVLPNRTVLI